jgi:Domain of unknown function (DUF4375)
MSGGRLTTVVVRRAAYDAASQPDKAYLLAAAVVDYVNDLMRAGVYTRHEMPAAAVQAFQADFYLAQVNNGGHSQFIRNAGSTLPTACTDALAGLEAMGAQAQHRILADMMAWMKANPAEAAAQNGFSVRAARLDELDKQFYAVEREMPMTQLSARWIASWPELRVVAAEQYPAAIDQIAQLNPYLGPRRIWQSVQQLRFQMTDQLQITVAASCGAVKPEPELKLAVRAGAFWDIEGQQCKAFGVGTDKGSRLCVFEEAGGRLYEFVRRSPPPEDTKPAAFKNYQAMVAGARLSTVGADTIRQFAEIADQTLAAEAIDLLLRKASLDAKSMITAWRLHHDGATWIAVAGQTRAVATTFGDRAALIERDGTPIVTITRAEIEHHAREAATGRATMEAPA